MTDHLEAIRLGPFSRSLMTTLIGIASRALNGHQVACLALPMAAIVFGGTARGDLVAQYSFTDITAGVLNRNATTVAANVTAGSITDSPTVNAQVTSVLTRATGIGYATQPVLAAARGAAVEGSVRSNVYFTFAVSANSGFELDLSSLTFNVAQGSTSAVLNTRDYDIRTSLDNFANSLTGTTSIGTNRPTFTPVTLNLSGAQFQDLMSPLTFQFRFFSTTGAGQNIDFDDITVNGTVAAVPEASSLAFVLVSLIGVGGLRLCSSASFLRK
jgi:hypothetical protein